MDFDKACMMFAMREPYYGIILASIRKTPMPASVVPTMGVGRCGNVFQLAYNPAYVESLDNEQIMEALKHEMLHLCFYHITMWQDFDNGIRPEPEIRNLRNLAADIEVNCYLDKRIREKLKVYTAEDYGFPERLGAVEYFKRLKALQDQQQQEQEQEAQDPDKPCNGGKGGDSPQQQQDNNQNGEGEGNGYGSGIPKPNNDNGQRSCDDHSQWPDTMDETDFELTNQSIDDMIAFAAEETEKARGTIPAEMMSRVKTIREKPKPVADWRRYFRRFCGNEFTDQIRKSKKRESKRFPDAAGNRHQRKSHILVAIDTSGSVSMPEYLEFFGQIKTLSQKATFHVVECDTRICHEYDYKGKPNEVLHGHGGTDFQPPVDMFNKNRRKYDALVYFTDGGAPIPNDTPKNTLWVVSSQGNHDKQRYLVNGAAAVFIHPKTTSR